MEKILLAYDGTEPAKRALATAGRLAQAFGARLGVVGVAPARSGWLAGKPFEDDGFRARVLLEAGELLRAMGIDAELFERVGDPDVVIEEIAERGGYDTVILGRRDEGPVGRILREGVTGHVAPRDGTVVIAH